MKILEYFIITLFVFLLSAIVLGNGTIPHLDYFISFLEPSMIIFAFGGYIFVIIFLAIWSSLSKANNANNANKAKKSSSNMLLILSIILFIYVLFMFFKN